MRSIPLQDENITIRGAREHNLKNIDLELPKEKLIVFTGVSGSGKSSLAFDTLYAEGQRRYVESLSAYARQFLGQLAKPDVDFIGGLSPAISIDQKSSGNNPRSTVATITEIYDYLRVLLARAGIAHCPKCKSEIGAQTVDDIIDQILALPARTRVQLLAPVVKGRRGEHREILADALKSGYARARVDGQIFDLMDEIRLEGTQRHDIEIVIDRIIIKDDIRSRLAEAVETALDMGDGALIVNVIGDFGAGAKARRVTETRSGSAELQRERDRGDILFSKNYACHQCNLSYEPPSPQMFSFNSPAGACPTCKGLGMLTQISPDLVVPDKRKSLQEGAIVFWGKLESLRIRHLTEGLANHYGFSLNTPWEELTAEQRQAVLYGSGEAKIKFVYRSHQGRRWAYEMQYRGVIPEEERKYFQSKSNPQRAFLSRFVTSATCPDCHGSRLRPIVKSITIGGKSILDIVKMTVRECQDFFAQLTLNERQQIIAAEALKEIKGRLLFLENVGLHYLTLDRTAPTLSGGEAQRIRLASQIGAGLVGVLYILDEPSIGLHQRDNQRLLATLKQLRDQGNTVIVVEHDEETIRNGDYVVDFGPGAGIKGGDVVTTGTPWEISQSENSLTGHYLSGKRIIPIPATRRQGDDRWIDITGARHNNLKNINVKIPVGVFTGITGVSGSGKSSLISDTLLPVLDRELMHAKGNPGAHDAIKGIEYLDKVIDINQSPIGRTPRSNPATYVKVFDRIRNLYAQLPEAKIRGYKPGRFSFNVKGGRCEVCDGNGLERIEMHFLADVWVKCDICNGRRYNDETLQIEYKGKNITDVLEMDVQEALGHFENLPKITRILQTLHDVGLDYIKLGQPSHTLSGGEAQRVKLARELCKASTGKTLYILDEPTTGLHFDDVQKLLNVLHRLVDAGNTVVVIEHNPEVIKTADYLIDLGPEGGEEGGKVVAVGTPEEIAQVEESHTGKVLQKTLAECGRKEMTEGWMDGRMEGRVEDEVQSRYVVPLGRSLVVKGAREHNLKNIDVEIPHRQMTTFTGISGSGKSSLALDTIYAEGQRRYVESLSAYARQFLGQLEKPKVENIEGLSPAIAIEQKTPSVNPRSTVGTVTEIYDYMRVLYTRIGIPYCPQCGREIGAQTAQQIVDQIMELEENTRLYILSPLKLERNEDYEKAFRRIHREGYARICLDGAIYELSEMESDTFPTLDRRLKHEVEIVVDRLTIREDERSRLTEAVETALHQSGGIVSVASVQIPSDDSCPPDQSTTTHHSPLTNNHSPITTHQFSEHLACIPCGLSFRELTPQHFSFNSPLGMCARCEGLGVLRGGKGCPKCQGSRIQPEGRAVKLAGKAIAEVTAMTIRDAYEFFENLTPSEKQQEIAREVLKEIRNRLRFLLDVGLHYLTLDRPAPTLAGGEAQRIRLGSQLGSGLTGVLYVLDEPTIGLHPRDNQRLLSALKRLRDLGNSVIVVEHDRNTILASDRVVDFGPGAGIHGGEIVAQGAPDEVRESEISLTGKYLRGDLAIEAPPGRRLGKRLLVEIIGARHNNLKSIDVRIPLGTLTCVTGVSGSGKSSLIEDILYKELANRLRRPIDPKTEAFKVGENDAIRGVEHIDKIINIDQKPIGETPRSNPATYTDVFTDIRYLFAELPEAKIRGFTSRRFSFNLKVGQCESCRGNGFNRIEMHFLPDVWIKCESCGGTGYNRETLQIKYRGKNIAEVLAMTAQEALEHFESVPKIRRKLQTLCDVGLDYIQLGQSATTLSGGEAQRVKLAKELAKRSTGKTLYIMDEPTTGLHFADIQKLMKVIHSLVDKGNTIVVIEHNLDVIKCADYIIDLGPEGGDEGGYVVACGTPEEIMLVENSHTGRFLQDFL